MQVQVQKHIEPYNSGNILADIAMRIQSDAEKVKKGLFGSA